MSDETVRVPAALVEALRHRLQVHRAEGSLICPCTITAEALVDAAERPDEGEDECAECGNTGGYHSLRCSHRAVITRVAAPLVACPKCGHDVDSPDGCSECPAPLSSPRRTRDEGTEDEAEAAWQAWCAHPDLDSTGRIEQTEEAFFKAGFLAARTAALIDRLEGTREYHTGDCMDAWMLPCRCGGDTRRAERAERERDRLEADWGNAGHELAALRAAVTGLADEWEAKHYTSPARARASSPTLTFAGAACYLRALLTDEGDNDG